MKNRKIVEKNVFYYGKSMSPSFKEGDYLIFQATQITKISIGDVIFFPHLISKDTQKHCVHRVFQKFDQNLITRGDNNTKNDKEPVSAKNLIGRVTHYERNGKIHKVWNGRMGMLRARFLHGRLHVIRAAKFVLRKPYRLIKRTGIVAWLWRPEIETIHFQTQDGPLVKYIHKGRTVASCWTETNRWWFKRPYDFVINTKRKKIK
jgi:signal peptidase I